MDAYRTLNIGTLYEIGHIFLFFRHRSLGLKYSPVRRIF